MSIALGGLLIYFSVNFFLCIILCAPYFPVVHLAYFACIFVFFLFIHIQVLYLFDSLYLYYSYTKLHIVPIVRGNHLGPRAQEANRPVSESHAHAPETHWLSVELPSPTPTAALGAHRALAHSITLLRCTVRLHTHKLSTPQRARLGRAPGAEGEFAMSGEVLAI